jgi:hypothetical protein
MQTFTLGLGRGWISRAFGRNQLVRPSDRIEALVLALAVTVVVVAIPIVGAIGTAIHDSRSRTYAEQALTRHTVTATVTEDSTASVGPHTLRITTRSRWIAHGTLHSDSLEWDHMVKAGDELTIWVDNDGNYVGPPSPTNRAASDALGAAVIILFSISAVAVALASVVRCRLNRRRYAEWERELRDLANGGRTSSDPS